MKHSYKKQSSSLFQIYSFDVFDTCVTRCYLQPTDLFETLFLALLTDNNLPSQQRETTAKRLARSRIQAERTTREQTAADDITIQAIYQTLTPQLKAHNIDPAHALSEEIILEIASVSPILSTQQYIHQLRGQGHKVLFISDMYLPGTVVQQMLIDQGFTDGSDEVFVSADVGLSKGSGKLFSAVCKQLNITPKQLHHTGDNRYADVRAARRVGVKATYFNQGDPTRYEQGFRPKLIGSDWVRSQIIGTSRAVRLRHATADKEQRQHAVLAANLLAPLLTGYVAWVLTTAQEMGIERLYFEDGLLAIAQTICNHWQEQTQNKSGRSPLPTCDAVANAPIRANAINQANKQIEQTIPWAAPLATVELANSNSNPPIQNPHLTVTQHNTKNCYHFRLLSPHEQTQEVSSQQSDVRNSVLPYIEAPLTTHKRTEGTAYLFQYRSLLQHLIATINSPALPIYRVIVLDYATTLAASSALQSTNNTLALDMTKRYAIGNIIRFLATPTRAEAQALIEAQKQLAPMAKPIHLQEISCLIKRFIKGSNAKATNRWLEGSLAISSWPLQTFFNKARQFCDGFTGDRA